MRIEQLEALVTVTRLGSIRRASEALHLSQPALSETIQNLEAELRLTLLDRQRTGARISAAGRELLPYIGDVIEAADRLRAAAGEQQRSTRLVRIGTVNAATASLLNPAISDFHRTHPQTRVEVLNTQQADIHRMLLDGGLDLGLVNLLDGDDPDPELDSIELLRGRAGVCCPGDGDLARQDAVTLAELLEQPLIGMRPGYVMYRFTHRLLGSSGVDVALATDGAEMGKLMVAQGLGVTLLPDYSVIGDPMERAGLITWRPLAIPPRDAEVVLMVQCRRSRHLTATVRNLHAVIARHARAFRG